jgi:carbonic anhydrase
VITNPTLDTRIVGVRFTQLCARYLIKLILLAEITMNDTNEPNEHPCCNRRSVLKTAFGVTVAGIAGGVGLGIPSISYAAALTREERDKLTPDQIIAGMKKGNDRFRTGKMKKHDYVAQKKASAAGQFPSAVILSCIDSRAPAEIIFNAGIGDFFNARIAGNIANNDLIGSLEFACAAAGAKVILVMGHTACGAIMGAIDNVELGSLTGLLDKIKPAINATTYSGERSSKNEGFVDAVAKTNVQQTINEIRKESTVLSSLEKDGKLKIVSAMYHLNDGKVEFI